MENMELLSTTFRYTHQGTWRGCHLSVDNRSQRIKGALKKEKYNTVWIEKSTGTAIWNKSAIFLHSNVFTVYARYKEYKFFITFKHMGR